MHQKTHPLWECKNGALASPITMIGVCLCLSVSLRLWLPVCLALPSLPCLPGCLHAACLPGCLSVCLPAWLSVCLPVCLSACLSVCLSVCLPALPSLPCLPGCLHAACLPGCLPGCLSVCLSVCLPGCLSVCLPVCLPVCLSLCLPACPTQSALPAWLPACRLPAWLSVCLPVCLSACLSVCLPVCLSVCLSLSVSLSLRPSVHPSVHLSMIQLCCRACTFRSQEDDVSKCKLDLSLPSALPSHESQKGQVQGCTANQDNPTAPSRLNTFKHISLTTSPYSFTRVPARVGGGDRERAGSPLAMALSRLHGKL